MRTILAGVFGVLLLLIGTVAGIGATALLVVDGCQESYRLVLDPADTVADAPEETTRVTELSGVQRTAVEAALEDRTGVAFTARPPLSDLTERVLVAGDDRYVPRLVAVPCRTPYEELALGGFGAGLVGLFVTSYALLVRRLA